MDALSRGSIDQDNPAIFSPLTVNESARSQNAAQALFIDMKAFARGCQIGVGLFLKLLKRTRLLRGRNVNVFEEALKSHHLASS